MSADPPSDRRRGLILLAVGAVAFAGLLAFVRSRGNGRAEAPSTPARRSDSPNVVLVTIDTLRADHVGAYGYPLPTTPELDAFARTATLFESAVSPATNTNPAHASIFTGLLPRRHGNLDNFYRMEPGPPLLAEALAGRGYRTGAFVSGYALLRRFAALDRGFSTWDEEFDGRERRGKETVDRAIAWLGKGGDAPFFLFVHLFDPHGPYRAPSDARKIAETGKAEPVPLERIPEYQRLSEGKGTLLDLRSYRARYDSEIAYADGQLGRLLDALEAGGDLERSIVIVTADHGESLGERYHVLDHGASVYEEEIRVPLVVRFPGGRGAGRRHAPLVSTVDVTPTVLAAIGIPASGLDGSDLAAAAEKGIATHETVVSEARTIPFRYRNRTFPQRLDVSETIKGVRSEFGKLVTFPVKDGMLAEFFDLRADPGELHPSSDDSTPLAKPLVAKLNAHLESPLRKNPQVDPKTVAGAMQQFKSLGYLN